MRRQRRDRPDLEVGAGEKLLAWAETADGTVVGGTRDALYAPARVPWEQVEAADWDRETTTLRVSEVGSWGQDRPEHVFVVEEPGRLLELIRERVTASVVYQRHVPLEGRRGLRVIARRAPGLAGMLTWVYEYDEGVDPDDAGRPAGGRRGPGRGPQRGRARLRYLDSSGPPALANVCPHVRSPVAQLAERLTVNQDVVGSSPTGGATQNGL